MFDANANLMLAGEKQELDHTVRFNAKQIQAIADTVGGVAAIIVVDDIVKYSKPGSPLKTVAKKRKYLPDVNGKFRFVKAWSQSSDVKLVTSRVHAKQKCAEATA